MTDSVTGSPLVVCFGEVLWDLFPDGARLGGAPANTAYHLAALGRAAALVSRVGDDDLGERALSSMRASGIDTGAVRIDPSRPTGRVEIRVEGGEPTYSLVEGCAWEAIELGDEAAERLSRAAALLFGTLAQRSASGREALRRALAAAPSGCLAVCDPNLRPSQVDEDLLAASVAAADVVKVNEREAEILSERFGADDPAGWLIEDKGARLVAITRGERGSVLVDRDGRYEDPGVPAAAGGDNVGAGDAFLAALIHGALAGAPLEAMSRAANLYASAVASQKGATPEIPAEVLRELAGLTR